MAHGRDPACLLSGADRDREQRLTRCRLPLVPFLNGTLIALAAVWAGRCAFHKSWREVALSVPVGLIAALAAIAGPRGMWLVNGVGLCVLLLATAAIATSQRRGTRAHTVRMSA